MKRRGFVRASEGEVLIRRHSALRVSAGLGVQWKWRSDAEPVCSSKLRTRQRRLSSDALSRTPRSTHDAPSTTNTSLADSTKERRLFDGGVVRVGSYGVEEIGAELEKAAELVGGGEGGQRDGGGGGRDEGKVGTEKAFVGDLGEEDERVCVVWTVSLVISSLVEGGTTYRRSTAKMMMSVSTLYSTENGQHSPRKRANRWPTGANWPSPGPASTSA